MGLADFLYKNFNPEERRWREERRREAREIRQEAKEILSDAKDLYDDYKDLKGDTQRAANQLNDLIRSYNNYKSDVLKELNSDISVSIENFRRFNINSRIAAPPNLNSAPTIPTVNVSSIMTNLSGGSLNLISIALSAFSDPDKDYEIDFSTAKYISDKDYEEADRQRDAARDYYYKVQDALTDMKILYESLNNSRRYIDDEKSNLVQLMDKFRKIVNQLNGAMNRNSFTEQEARHLTGIAKIAEMIKNSLEQRIVGSSGKIESNYKIYGGKIREINGLIPAAPTISGSSDWLERLLTY